MGEIQNSCWNQRRAKKNQTRNRIKSREKESYLIRKIQRSVTRSMNLGQSICTRIRIFYQILFGLEI